MRYHIRAYAKINLILKVGPLRPDGYHALGTVYQTVNLWDDLTLTFGTGSDIRVAPLVEPLPEGADNLAELAARKYLQATGWKTGLDIQIDKQIPVGGGMGGGSSDAAAVLMVLNRVCPVPLRVSGLLKLACELGSDVPCFLVGGTVMGQGRGEVVHPLKDAAPFSLLAVMPGVRFSTAEMFRQLDRSGTLTDFALGNVESVIADPTSSLENDFDRVVSSVSPEVHAVMEGIRNLGYTTVLSGSGSTFLIAGAKVENVVKRVPEGWQIHLIQSKPRHMVSHVPIE